MCICPPNCPVLSCSQTLSRLNSQFLLCISSQWVWCRENSYPHSMQRQDNCKTQSASTLMDADKHTSHGSWGCCLYWVPKEFQAAWEANNNWKYRPHGTSLGVEWLRLRASKAGGTGSIPGQETRSHMLLLKPVMATHTHTKCTGFRIWQTRLWSWLKICITLDESLNPWGRLPMIK